MKPATIMLCMLTFLGLSDSGWAQDATPSPPGQAAPGPGSPLPQHSTTRTFDLSGLQKRAISFSDQIRGPATDLFTFFAILALIWTGYHAQFRGLQEFVGTLLRIVVTSALIANYKTMLPILLQSRDALKAQLYSGSFDVTAQLGAALANVGSTIGVMSLTGVAAGVALFGIVVVVVVIYSMQLLFEAVLVGFGPFAIAALAFSHSRGVFTMWLKTLVAVVLIPVGWLLGANFFSAIAGTDSASMATINDLLVTIIYIAGFGAIYAGMPFMMVWIVNSASGAAAAAMPSLIGSMSNLFAGGSILSRGFSGSAMAVAHSSLGAPAGGIQTANPPVSGGPSAPAKTVANQNTVYEQRISSAHKVHEEIQRKPQNKTKT